MRTPRKDALDYSRGGCVPCVQYLYAGVCWYPLSDSARVSVMTQMRKLTVVSFSLKKKLIDTLAHFSSRPSGPYTQRCGQLLIFVPCPDKIQSKRARRPRTRQTDTIPSIRAREAHRDGSCHWRMRPYGRGPCACSVTITT